MPGVENTVSLSPRGERTRPLNGAPFSLQSRPGLILSTPGGHWEKRSPAARVVNDIDVNIMGSREKHSAKYIIEAKFVVEGVVEKHDVIGAIFGQTEGLFPKNF